MAGSVTVTAGGTLVATARVEELRLLSPEERVRRLGPFRRRSVSRGRARIDLETKRDVLRRRLRDVVQAGGGAVRVPERPVAASIRLPVVRQALRNNCESAALSMVLAGRGVRAGQLELQRALPRSGPLDPVLDASGGPALWGDPQRGYVGRPNGGGTSGGYGVYERPVRALARHRGVALRNLTGADPNVVYRRLLSGRPVMAWVGLSDGPYARWRTPRGGRVAANFGEHTVVLTAVRGNLIEVNDPLIGRRTRWTRARFEQRWQRLGRRALGA